MSRRILLAATTCMTMVVFAGHTQAEETEVQAGRSTQDSTATVLEEVLVSARSLEQTLPLELSRYGSVVEVLTAEQIRDGGFVDVVQALELMAPGVTISTQAGAFSYANISLQGSRNSDVLWTVDGVRMGNRLYNSTSPADTLPAAMVERVEVLKGGQGLFFGTQAVAGVINVVTRPFTDRPEGSITAGVDSNSGWRLNGHYSNAIGDHNFVLWASHDQTDGYEIYDAYQPNTTSRHRAYDVTSIGVKYGYDFTDDLSMVLQYIHTEAALDYPSVRGNSINDRVENVAIARLDYKPSERIQLFLKSYYRLWDTDYYTPPNPSSYWGFEDFGINGVARLNLHRGVEYHVGYEFQNYRGQDDVLLIAGETERVHAVFGQVRTNDDFSTRLRLAAGARHNSAPDSNSTVWSVSGEYDLSDFLQIEGSIGTSFLLPDAQQIYGIDPCCALGNPALKPEESFNVNVGLGGRLGDSQWLVSVWDRRIDNLIVTDRTNPPPGYPGLFVNIDDEVRARGFEATVRGPLGADFSYLLSYTFSEERARGTTTQIAGRPEHAGKANLNWSPQGPFGASLSLKYIGETEVNVAGFGVQPYGDYVVANLGAHVHLDSARRTRINARVENLFDTDYATSVSSAVITGSTTGQRFMFRRLGVPRTFSVNISHSF